MSGETYVARVTVGTNTIVKRVIVGTPIKSVRASGSDLNIVGDSGTGVVSVGTAQTLTFDGVAPLTAKVGVVDGRTVTFTVDNATGQRTGVAKFDSDHFNVDVTGNVRLNMLDSSDQVTHSLIPDTDSAYDLGSSSKKWRKLYVSGSTIQLGNLNLRESNGEFSATVAATGVPVAVNLDGNTTDNLTEGSTNLYYTRARVDSALGDATSTATIRGYFQVLDLGGDGSLAYDSATGNISYTGPSASEVRSHFQAIDAGGDGSFTYDSATGTLTYTGPSAAQVRAHLAPGTGVTYDSSAGTISIGQPVATTDNVTFANITGTGNAYIAGNLTVQGTTTTVNSTEVTINDKNIVLADSAVNNADIDGGGLTLGGGLYTGGTKPTFTYTATNDRWSANKSLNVSGAVTADSATFTNLTRSSPSGVTAGAYGSATEVPVVTVDASGFIDSIGTSGITVPTFGTDYVDSATVSTIITTDVDSAYIAARIGGPFIDSAYFSANVPTFGTDYVDSATVSTIITADVDSAYIAARIGGPFIDSAYFDANVPTFGTDYVDSATVLALAAPNQTITAGVGLGGGGSGSTVTVNIDSAELLAYFESSLRHDNLSGFVANEHIDHSGVSITAGTGLTGGGTIASTRDLAIDSAEFLAYFEGSINHDNLSGFVANEHIDHSGVTITAGTGLTGGGTIASTRTLAVDSAQLIAYYNSSLVHDDLSGFVANEHIDHSGVTLTAGAGLTGGGTIASSRSFAVGAGTGVTVNADDVAIGQPVGTTDSVTFGGLYASGNVIVAGNLTVNGTQTIVNSTTVQIDDKLLTLGDDAADSAGMNGGGIELNTTGGANPSILYTTSGDKFTVTKNWDVHGNITLSGTVDGVDVAGLEGRSIVAGSGLTGGGTLASSRTLNVGAGTGIAVAADAVAIDSAGLLAYYNSSLVHDDLSGFVANEHIDHSAVSITAGTGLTGGGTIASTRDLAIDSSEFLAYFNASIDHDALTNFVDNEHIDHTSVSITAGFGLAGGGTIASTRDLAIDSAELLAYYNSSLVHDNLDGFVANEHIDHSSVSITAGTGLTGGGTIASTRDLAIDSAEFLAYFEGSIRHDNLDGFVANEHIDHSSVSITAGVGLTGGGTIASTRDLAIDSSEFLAYFEGSIRHDNLDGFVANEHIDHSSVSITAGTGLTGGGTIASTRDLAIDSSELNAYFGGAGKGFDADTLDGQEGTYYRINVYNAAGSLLN